MKLPENVPIIFRKKYIDIGQSASEMFKGII